MGKSKRRILHAGKNNQIPRLSREEALCEVVKACNSKKLDSNAMNLLTLFGLSAEELLENGASYEDVLSLKGLLSD